jgi:hypothetical protein
VWPLSANCILMNLVMGSRWLLDGTRAHQGWGVQGRSSRLPLFMPDRAKCVLYIVVKRRWPRDWGMRALWVAFLLMGLPGEESLLNGGSCSQ